VIHIVLYFFNNSQTKLVLFLWLAIMFYFLLVSLVFKINEVQLSSELKTYIIHIETITSIWM